MFLLCCLQQRSFQHSGVCCMPSYVVSFSSLPAITSSPKSRARTRFWSNAPTDVIHGLNEPVSRYLERPAKRIGGKLRLSAGSSSGSESLPNDMSVTRLWTAEIVSTASSTVLPSSWWFSRLVDKAAAREFKLQGFVTALFCSMYVRCCVFSAFRRKNPLQCLR